MTRRNAASLLLLLLLAGLAGCSMTVFESLPAGRATHCDPAWPGHWQRLPKHDPAPPPDTAPLQILPGCRSVIANGEEKPLDLTLIDSGGRQYLRLKPGAGPDCAGKGNTRCGLLLFRYDRDGDTIQLHEPDHAWVSAAIQRGDLEGYSAPIPPEEVESETPLRRNFVAGDADRIAALLAQHPFFDDAPLLLIRRVPAPAVDAQPQEP